MKQNESKKPKKNETESQVFSILSKDESEKIDDTKIKLENLKEEFENVVDKETTTNKRGRPKGSTKKKKQVEAEKIEFAETISGVASTTIELIVSRLPNPKPLTDTEKKQVDTAFDKVAYKYANWLGNYQEESAFILVLLMIFIPRLNLLKPKKSEKNVDEQKS